jgi:hypothetical protein
MVDETLFDYLHMAVVEYYLNENENDLDASSAYLSQIGKNNKVSFLLYVCLFERLSSWLFT